MKTIKVISLIALMGAFAYGADGGASPPDEPVGGTIPFIASWTFTATSQTTNLANVTYAMLETGYIDVLDIQVCSDLDSNDTLSIAAKIGSWTLPGQYPTQGNKNSVTANSDFLIQITDDAAGHDDSLKVVNTFTAYKLLTSSDQTILASNTGLPNGIENQNFNIDNRIMLDHMTDIPGAYAITMTLTLSQE
ncbi:MAG: hypothetical protein H8E71_00810 [Candidatus Marinimicrobia bacterium]|nr:hypothetical protein [Candidatus Neomarinimicrobiota bacterium]